MISAHYRSEEARMDSQAAEQALRERRKQDEAVLWAQAWGVVGTVALLFWFASLVKESGLFNFLSSNQ